jgi:hypothetical protein
MVKIGEGQHNYRRRRIQVEQHTVNSAKDKKEPDGFPFCSDKFLSFSHLIYHSFWIFAWGK